MGPVTGTELQHYAHWFDQEDLVTQGTVPSINEKAFGRKNACYFSKQLLILINRDY